jgi:hypothetical protein
MLLAMAKQADKNSYDGQWWNYSWIVWTDLLFKRLENKRRQQVFLRGRTYVSLFIECFHGNQRGGR